MRRKDREITDPERIREILEQAEYGHLSLCCDNIPYGVTLNYGIDEKDGKLVLYFHSAFDGRKMDYIRKNPVAYFFAETDCRPYSSTTPFGEKYWTMHYASVAASGKIEFVDEIEEKYHALQLIMRKFPGDNARDIPEKVLGITAIWKLTVDGISAKQNPLIKPQNH